MSPWYRARGGAATSVVKEVDGVAKAEADAGSRAEGVALWQWRVKQLAE